MPDREILFRGKRLDSGEWVEGYYCCVGWTGQERHYIIPTYASALYGIEVAYWMPLPPPPGEEDA